MKFLKRVTGDWWLATGGGRRRARPTLVGMLLLAALVGLVACLFLPTPAKAQQVGLTTRVAAFNASALTICSNMTTNVSASVSAMRMYRGRPLAVLASFTSVTNEATALKVSFQVSTNAPGSASTNWFDPMPPWTLTYTNHSGILPQKQMCLIAATTLDGVEQIRIATVQNTSTTNNVGSVIFTGSTFP